MLKSLFTGKMNNRGSALLTVVLVVGFLTILATILLYITGMNFQIKQADYQNKKNFYTGEEALEEIRANLMIDTSNAAVEAYNDITMNFVSLQTKELRQLEYNNLFVTRVQEEWDADLLAHGGSWLTLLGSYCTGGVDYTLTIDEGCDANHDGSFSSSEVLELHPDEGYVRIKGLRMTYINPTNKLTTIISTDMDVYAPGIDWSAEGSVTSLEAGISPQEASRKTETDAAGSVRYANWKKE